MAIAPLQLPGPLIVPKLDFSPLDKIGDAYVENQQQQREAAAIADYLAAETAKRNAPLTSPPPPTGPRSAVPNYAPIPYSNVIGGLESSNKYDELGPVTKSGDRAYGKYQVMGANVAPWTKEALGKELTPEEFLKDPDAQDAVFKNKFGQYAQKYGPEGAARAWFAGEGGMNDLGRRDQLGTTVGQYGSRFATASQQPGQLPLGLRNNNPAYIPDGAVAKTLPGYKGAEGGYATFDTPESGLGAMDAILTSFGRRGVKTGGEIARQLPGMDSGNVDAMARFISPNGDPNAAIDLSDQAQRQQTAGRLAIFANGMHSNMGMTPPPSQTQMAQAAEGMSPDQIKRVQALYAAGPNARALANSIIAKYLGKNEYKFQVLPDGTMVRTNETTGTVEPVRQTFGTVNVKRPGAFGTTQEETMQRDENGNLRPLQITGAAPDMAAPSAGEGLTGEEYLKTKTPEERDVIRKIANYETDPRLLARGGPGHAAAVMSAVARFDPTYDQALYPARAAAYKEFFAGGNSSPAGQLTAGNTAIQHLGRVQELSDKIGGTSDYSILNKPLNKINEYIQEHQNNPDLVRYKGAMDRFVEEATKFYRGTGGNEADINRALSNMTAGQSPEARTAAIREQAELMQSKINALSSRLQTALGPKLWEKAAKENPELVITQKKSADVMSRLRGETPAASAPALPADTGSAAGQPQEGQRRQFKQGWGIFHNGQWVPAPTGPRA